jgi:hypothetical protein
MEINWRLGDPPAEFRTQRLLIVGTSQDPHQLEICVANYNKRRAGIVPTWLGGQDQGQPRPIFRVDFWIPLAELELPGGVKLRPLKIGDLVS